MHFLATALFSISDPLNIVIGFFFFTSALGVQSVCTLHVTQPPVSLPVPPEALISCWESVELDKGHGSGPLGARIRACYSTESQSGHISIHQKIKLTQGPVQSQRQSGIMSPSAKAGAFYFPSRNMSTAVETRAWSK